MEEQVNRDRVKSVFQIVLQYGILTHRKQRHQVVGKDNYVSRTAVGVNIRRR